MLDRRQFLKGLVATTVAASSIGALTKGVAQTVAPQIGGDFVDVSQAKELLAAQMREQLWEMMKSNNKVPWSDEPFKLWQDAANNASQRIIRKYRLPIKVKPFTSTSFNRSTRTLTLS